MSSIQKIKSKFFKILLDINHRYLWSELGKKQHLKSVRSMYIWLLIVPIIAKSFSQIESVADITVYGHQFTIHLGLPFSWKIFYFSALAFVIANLIYGWKCYPIIQENSNYADFLNAMKSFRHIQEYALPIAHRLEVKRAPVGQKLSSLPASNPMRKHIFHYDQEKQTIYKQELTDEASDLKTPFHTLYEASNKGRRECRWICGVFYDVGFIGIAYIVVENLAAVLKML